MLSLDALHQSISNGERLQLVSDYPLAEIVSAPAHRELRHPDSVRELAIHMRAGQLAVALEERFLIGIFTEEESGSVTLRAVECLDGHHRLLAGLLSGAWQRIGDIPPQSVDTVVNGLRPHATEPESRWIPLEAAVQSAIPTSEWRELPIGGQVRGPTAEISGEISSIDEVFAPEHRGVPLAELLAALDPL
jgi:hypothetical protein